MVAADTQTRPLDVALLPAAGPDSSADLMAALRAQVPLVALTPEGPLSQRIAARSDRPLALIPADLVLSAVPLGAVLDDPRLGSAALAAPGPEPASWQFLDVLKIDGPDRARAAQLAEELENGADDVPLLELTRALAAAGVGVTPVPLTGYVWAHPLDAAETRSARAGVAALDERYVRLREAARGGDGVYSTLVVRRLSWRLTDLALRLGVTPNQVTVASLLIGLGAALCLAASGTGGRGWAVLGAVLLQLSLLVDCVDGELARFRRRFSRFGAWLDASTDRVKEFAVIGALAFASDRAGHPVWLLAAVAVVLQTFRNEFEVGWGLQRGYLRGATRPNTWVRNAEPLRFNRIARPDPGFSWVRRLGHFPVGERFLLISVAAAVWTPRGTLALLVAGGALAAGYMLAAFAVRRRSSSVDAPKLAALFAGGPVLGPALRRATVEATAFAALAPAVLAVAELVALWVLVERVDVAPEAALALVTATALAHYLHVYGVRDGAAAVRRGTGTDGRLLLALVLGVVSTLAPRVATPGTWLLAALVLVEAVVGSLRDWTDDDSRVTVETRTVEGAS
ncbi:CDP-alcohol phosphatidyltransferase family protein [Spongisporangium articulatum]|uniref:CDP-alcohol phosphatidyltransferase family protein n=1 Tax=Spongisporangium articulatum TaxID=3362603 RepID=A0ABW8AQE3_9ACTN